MKMNNPKRKVTDLLPSEAILISSDADLKVLEEFEKAGVVWYGNRSKATEWTPFKVGYSFPFVISNSNLGLAHIADTKKYTVLPATDFIPTEAEKVEVDKFETTDFKLGVFIRSRIDWYESNHDYQVATDTIRCWLDDFLQQHETRNPETK